jgi:RNA polymerase sigma-70 factor (ECF subfamily)
MADTRVRTLPAGPAAVGCCEPLRAEPRLVAAPPSFERLVADHGQRVTRLCYRLLGWREDVEDVVQEVFLAAFRALPEFRGESSGSTWLTRIAVNKCRSHMRKRVALLRLFTGVRTSRRPGIGQPADRGLLDDERFERVRHAVRKLPPKYREVIVLHYLEEMSAGEIADVLGRTRNAVEVRLNRARGQLKEDLAGMLEG